MWLSNQSNKKKSPRTVSYYPKPQKKSPQKGTVLAVGPGERDEKGDRIALDVQVGDVVLFAKYSGTEIKYDGKKLLIMRESDILAIL